MLLKSSHILPLLNSEESSSDFSTVMFYLLVWWIRALFQRNLMWRAVVWLKWDWEGRCVSGGRRGMRDTLPYGTSDITHLLTAHSSLPAASTSISMSFSLSFVSLNSDVFACPAQLCDWKLLLWFSERASAVLRLIVIPADACVFEVLWLQSCVFDAHALLWSALDYTYKDCLLLDPQWYKITIFTAAVLIYHTRDMITKILT